MSLLLHAALAWLASHPADVTLALCGAVSTIVAYLPPRFATLRYVGLAIRVVDRLSILTHSADAGTLKWPGIASNAFQAAMAELRKA